MYGSVAYAPYAPARERGRTLFGQTMGLVALTAAIFAGGAYAGRNASWGVGIVCYIAAIASLIVMHFTARRSPGASTALLLAFGALLGVASAPTLVYYAATSPRILWQAGGATALFVAVFGAAGYATRRDLSRLWTSNDCAGPRGWTRHRCSRRRSSWTR